jgi:hypothetical protein
MVRSVAASFFMFCTKGTQEQTNDNETFFHNNQGHGRRSDSTTSFSGQFTPIDGSWFW